MRIFRKSEGDRGVTLIELAVVMAIVGIMALFMAPAIGEWIDNFRIRQAAREVSGDLQFAKMKSISTGVRCAIVFDEHGYIIFPDYDNDMVLDTADYPHDLDGDGVNENETTDILKSALLGRNISFDTSQAGGRGIDFPLVNDHPAVAFNRSGLPIENSPPVPVTNQRNIFLQNTKNNKHLQVTISPSGRIGINEY